MMYVDIKEKAKLFAINAHKGQIRKSPRRAYPSVQAAFG